jgi:hypothetical protein
MPLDGQTVTLDQELLSTEFERTFVRRTKKRCDCNDSDL